MNFSTKSGNLDKKILGIFLSILFVFVMLPCVTAQAETESETISYVSYPQGTLQNIAAGKNVTVSSLKVLDSTTRAWSGGKNLTDDRNESYWESLAEFPVCRDDMGKDIGSFATIDLGASYSIYRIELVGEEEALKNYEVYGITDGVWSSSGTRLMYNTSQGTNATVQVTSPALYTRYLSTATTVDQTKLGTNYVNLYGETFNMIRIQKTNSDAAKFAEIRVYGIEPKLIDVTPKTIDKLYCNETVPAAYPLTQAVDNDPDTFTHAVKVYGRDLRYNFDLGDKYYVRKTEYWPRVSIDAVDDASKRNFAVWTGNAENIAADITTESTGKRIGGAGENRTYQGTYGGHELTFAPGGTTLVMEHTPAEATQYVTFEFNGNDAPGHTLAEFRIFAEDRTPKNIEITNIADFNNKETLSDGKIRVDLGGYYNIKKVAVNGNSGAFKIVGNTTTTLGYDDAILAASPIGFSAETEYDVTLQNVVRYVTFCPKNSTSTLSDLKIYAEKGKKYNNVTENGTATAANNASMLIDGIISADNYAYGEHVYDVSVDATPQNTINIETQGYQTFEAISITFKNNNEANAWERNTFQLWGANSEDFSDKVLLASQGARTAASGNVWTVILDNPKPYKYLVMTTYENGKPVRLNDYLHYYGTPSGTGLDCRENTPYYEYRSIRKVKCSKSIHEIQIFGENALSEDSDEVVVNSLNVTDENGLRLPYSFSKANPPYFNLSIRKLGVSPRTVNLIMAEYSDEGMLVGVDLMPIDTAELEQFETRTYTASLNLKGESGTVKAFVFTDDVTPLCESISYGNLSIFPDDILDKEVSYQLAKDVKNSSGVNYANYSIHDANYDIDAIFYDGSVYNGKQTKVFAYVGIPKGASKDNPVPAVVLVHGGGGESYLYWVKEWNDRGYAAISMDLYGNGPDKKAHPYAGSAPYDWVAFLKDFENAGMYQNVVSVINAHNILRSFDAVDNDKIGVTGISWGGVITTIACGVDDRFNFAAPVYGSGYLDYSRTYFSSFYLADNATDEWDPINFASNAKMPVLYVNSDSDIHFSMNCTSLSSLKTPNAYMCIKHDYPHGQISDIPEVYSFADKVCSGNETPFIKFENISFTKGKVELDAIVPQDLFIQRVYLYYTTADELYYGGGAANIGWNASYDYEIYDDNHIEVLLPEDAKLCYVSVKDTNGNIVSTPLLSVSE